MVSSSAFLTRAADEVRLNRFAIASTGVSIGELVESGGARKAPGNRFACASSRLMVGAIFSIRRPGYVAMARVLVAKLHMTKFVRNRKTSAGIVSVHRAEGIFANQQQSFKWIKCCFVIGHFGSRDPSVVLDETEMFQFYHDRHHVRVGVQI